MGGGGDKHGEGEQNRETKRQKVTKQRMMQGDGVWTLVAGALSGVKTRW